MSPTPHTQLQINLPVDVFDPLGPIVASFDWRTEATTAVPGTSTELSEVELELLTLS